MKVGEAKQGTFAFNTTNIELYGVVLYGKYSFDGKPMAVWHTIQKKFGYQKNATKGMCN